MSREEPMEVLGEEITRGKLVAKPHNYVQYSILDLFI